MTEPNVRLYKLAARIRTELTEIERVLERIQEGWQRSKSSADDYYLDSVALNLHGYYSGLERIFELIATIIDGSKPTGQNWHQLLLRQMTEELSGVRPAVISPATYSQLDEYRGFRHIVRNVYTFKFDPVKIERLVRNVPASFSKSRTELLYRKQNETDTFARVQLAGISTRNEDKSFRSDCKACGAKISRFARNDKKVCFQTNFSLAFADFLEQRAL
jgi:hypothetical protein